MYIINIYPKRMSNLISYIILTRFIDTFTEILAKYSFSRARSVLLLQLIFQSLLFPSYFDNYSLFSQHHIISETGIIHIGNQIRVYPSENKASLL